LGLRQPNFRQNFQQELARMDGRQSVCDFGHGFVIWSRC
jgi:hypothetical protein